MTTWFSRTILLSATWIASLLMATVEARGGLTLYPAGQSKYDLIVKGLLTEVVQGGEQFLRWTELRSLPTEIVSLKGEFVEGEQDVTVIFLSDLLKQLPLVPNADTVVATCSDGYVAVYPYSFISAYRPFLVLEINHEGPEKWPPAGLHFDPGPYVISVAAKLAPEQPPLLDVGHKRPWGVVSLEIVNYSQYFKKAYTGNWAKLSARAEAGRDIWINSCASCHLGPDGMAGGTKSERPFAVLRAEATACPDYLKRYVRNPQGTVPGAKMEAHPHYTDTQLDALIAFIAAEAPVTSTP